MRVKILKGTNEIGGNTIEISTNQTTLIFDYGTPLDNSTPAYIEKANAVILSHSHPDHYGEIAKLNVPIYAGKITKDLILASILFNPKLVKFNLKEFENLEFKTFESWKSFKIGDIKITPYLVDHSATDAYSFLIEADGKKVFYTGDFRANGRKNILFEKILKDKKLKNVDLMIIEGTMINRENRYKNEEEVEREIKKILKEGFCVLISSSQNIDRLVSAYKAAKSLDRIFVIDIYTAWILEIVSKKSKGLMKLGFDNLKVYKPTKQINGYQYGIIRNNPKYFKNFKFKIFKEWITFDEIKKNPDKYFIKIGANKVEEIKKLIKKPNIIYSMWDGYTKDSKLYDKLKKEYNFYDIHTSGHITKEDLEKFINSLNPKKIIPIHTEKKSAFRVFENALVVDDNEEILV